MLRLLTHFLTLPGESGVGLVSRIGTQRTVESHFESSAQNLSLVFVAATFSYCMSVHAEKATHTYAPSTENKWNRCELAGSKAARQRPSSHGPNSTYSVGGRCCILGRVLRGEAASYG